MTKYPALKILIGVCIGFALGYISDLEQGLYFPFIIFTSGIFLSLLILKFKTSAFVFATLLIGFMLSFRIDSNEIKTPEKMIAPFSGIVEGEISDIIRYEKKYIRVIITGSVDSRIFQRIEQNRTMLTILSVDKRPLDLNIGNKIAANVMIRPPRQSSLPGEFSEKQYAKANNLQWIARSWARDVSILEKPKAYEVFISNIRRNISDRLSSLLPEKTEGIAIALLTGDKSKIPYEVKQHFSFTGTAHVLAVSGLHVGIISLIIYLLLGFIYDLRIKFLIFSVLVLAFVILTGSHASSIRAGMMAITAMFIFMMQRKAEPLNILAFVVLIVILATPHMIFSIGFQMSVSAIAGIIVFYKPVKNFFVEILGRKENILFNKIIASISLTISASITVSPIIAYYFGVFSIISPMANLFCVPLIFLGMIFTMLSIVFSYIYFPVGECYAESANLAYSTCIDINALVVKMTYSYIDGNESIVIAIITTIIFVYFFTNFRKEKLLFRIASAVAFFFMSLYVFYPRDNYVYSVFPREDIVAIELPARNSLYMLIADRKPGLYPLVDRSLLYYLEEKSKPLTMTIAISGNCGIALTDKLKKNRKIRIIEISIDEQRKYRKILNLKHEVPQIIDY